MANGGVLSVDVQANISNFANNLKKASAQATAFADNLSSKVGKHDPFVTMRENAARVGRDFKQIVQGIILAQTFYQGIQGFKNLTATVYEYTDSLNYAKTTFANLFNDGDLAEEFIAVLQEYAARSPFDFTDVEEGAMQLKAYGIEAKNLMFVMEGIGNLAAVTGNPETFERVSRAMGQINAKGKLMGEEMRQLAEAGLDVSKVYAKLGIEAGDVGKAGIDSATALNTIVEVLNESYGGALKAANTTMRGLIANAKDVALIITSSIFQPMYDVMRRGIYTIELSLDQFRNLFVEGGLGYAIEQFFGEGSLNRISRFISVLSSFGNLIYQMLAPAFQLFAMYGEALITVLMQIYVIINPVIQAFLSVYNTVTQSAVGVRILQGVLYALAAGFALAKMHALSLVVISAVSKVVTLATTLMTAATSALAVAAATSGNAAIRAAAGWQYFAASLRVHPILLAIAVIGTLIATLFGLKKILGMTGDAATNFGIDTSKITDWLNKVKTGMGDIEKFNKPFDTENIEQANDDLEDTNGALEKTKKAQEGLLSFDEVFKLPETADPTPKTGGTDLDADELQDVADLLNDISNWEPPEIEPLDFGSLLPDLVSLDDLIEKFLEHVKKLDFGDWAALVTNALNTGLMAVKGFPKKLIEEIEKWKPVEWLKNFKERFKTAIKEAFDDLKEAPKRVSEFPGKVTQAIDKWHTNISTKITEFKSKIRVSVENAFDDLKNVPKAVSEFPGKVKEAIDKWHTDISTKITEFKGKIKASVEGAFDDLKSVPKAVSDFPGKVKEAIGKWHTDISTKITEFKGKIKVSVEGAFDDLKSVPKAVSEFPSKVAQAIKEWPGKLSVSLNTFKTSLKESVLLAVKGGMEINTTSITEALGTRLKGVFSGGKIVEFLKFGIKDAGLSLIGDFLFDQIAEGIREDNPALSAVLDKFSFVLASGLSALILTRNPVAAVGAMIVTAIFEAISGSLETGDWSTSVGEILSGLGIVLSKFAGKGFNPLAIGGIIGELLFHGIAEWIRGNGDEATADTVDSVGTVLGDALGGAGFGAAIGSIVPGLGTALGAVIGGALGLAYGVITEWGDDIANWWTTTAWPWLQKLPERIGEGIALIKTTVSNWWNNTAVPFLQSLPGKIGGFIDGIRTTVSNWWSSTVVPFFQSIPSRIQGFFTNANTWLSDPGKNIFAGLWNGITQVWDGIVTFFKGIFGTIIGFFTGDKQLLHDSGYNIMDGLWKGITGVWNIITGFFTGIFKNILAFFTGDSSWLTKDGNQILQGLLNGILSIWTNITTWFAGVPTHIKNFFTGAINWLTTAGTNIINGLRNAITTAWTTISTWFINLPTNIKNFFSNAISWLTTAGTNIINGLRNAITTTWTNISTWFINLPTNIKNFFSNAISWLTTAGTNLINGLKNAITTTWTNIHTWFINLPTNIKNFFTNAANWLFQAGKNIISGFFSGLKDIWENVKSWFSGIGDWIVEHKGPRQYDLKLLEPAGRNIMTGFSTGLETKYRDITAFIGGIGNNVTSAFKYAGDWLKSSGTSIINGLLSGISSTMSNLRTWVSSIVDTIRNSFKYAGDWLKSSGSSVISGLTSGISSAMSNLRSWVSSIVESIRGTFTYAGDWLKYSGSSIIYGLVNGFGNAMSNLRSWISSIVDTIRNAFTYAGTWLTSAGHSIVSGLWSGMSNSFNNLLSNISSWGATIASYKGPEEYDKRVLVKPGNWLVEGLEQGMTDRFNQMLTTVGTFGQQIEGAINKNISIVPSIPSIQQGYSSNSLTQGVTTVPNPYISPSNSAPDTSSPIMYVGTLIASDASLKELNQKLRLISLEDTKYGF